VKQGTLYLVSTPIGNLEDITLRALRVLKEVDLIACEDTRRTRILLGHYGIRTPLTSLYDEIERKKGEVLVEKLLEGRSLAYVSDAGTPLISDPGYHLVRLALEAGVAVVPIPGPSAVITALSVSALPSENFASGRSLKVKVWRSSETSMVSASRSRNRGHTLGLVTAS